MGSHDARLKDLNLVKLQQEVIHLAGKIQPHGILLVLEEPDLTILQISNNTDKILGRESYTLIGKKLEDILDTFQVENIKNNLQQNNLDFINPQKVWCRTIGDEYVVFDTIFHRNKENFLILELETTTSQDNIPFLSFYHLARASINQLGKNSSIYDLGKIIVTEISKVTGFDRVLLYKFDEDGHGAVIAEEKIDSLESYLGLHYPESDIPYPARKLFTANWIRIIPDTQTLPASLYPEINPLTQKPLDLTHSLLRSASQCHIQYLHNMGVGASLTISLMKDEQLWGLIACHHQTPKYVSYELRKACEFLGRVIFSEISALEETEDHDYRLKLSYIQNSLIEYMSSEDNFVQGLVKHQPNLLDLTNAQGAAICVGEEFTTLGETPTEEELKFLLQWLKVNIQEEIFYTDSLPKIYPDSQKYKNLASGLLVVRISPKNHVLWFRPEVIQTVNWGGDPNKAFETIHNQGSIKLSPRKSFELWKETVKLTCLPWKAVEIKAALELKNAIVNIILRQAEELAQLAQDLERSNAELKKFAYVASHDLQEPLNQVANYVQLLEMRYRQELDGETQEFMGYVVEGVSLMQTLIDDVLAYSRVDVKGIEFKVIEVEKSLERALNSLRQRIQETGAEITYESLPTAMADNTQLMQLFQNLIGNAIKFRGSEIPKIHIGAQRQEDSWLFSVSDNGIGLEPQFSERIFIIFQRLHTRDEYPGTGMGLAICKKIVECHRGRIWVESELGKGATFYFTIPLGVRERDHRNGRNSKNNFIS